jgi:cytochrome P450
MHDHLFAPEVAYDPYAYFCRLREEDPVHWNTRDKAWLITRYEDVVWRLGRGCITALGLPWPA